MSTLRMLFNPRWNLFDLFVWTLVVALCVRGHPILGALLYFVGALVSVLGEEAAEKAPSPPGPRL